MRRTPLAALAAAALIAVAGCTPAPQQTPQAPAASQPADQATAAAAMLAKLGLENLTPRQIVEKLDQDTTPRPLQMKASVRPDHLLIGDGTTEAALPIEGDNSFYLSIAPFVNRTHECHFHSLATCQGELVSKPVHVLIKDASGKVLIDQDATTYTNGFVAFWLPQGITGTVTVESDGKSGTVPFSSQANDDATCLTTLKLA
ncbi:MAG: CueP family metal-binding protein [Propioniciclava sp.]|uniref:CueP family metal-binding protein n=1 Tax=Propioniciclava sp. TaxID=2038686 RepID=UPI0039E27D95